MEYSWDPNKYFDLVENTSSPILQKYMRVELDYLINNIINPKDKTFIDVGAGVGRVIPKLSAISKGVIAVELDKQMLGALKKRSERYSNVLVVRGDAQELSEALKDFNIDKPVIFSLQNSLGTPYGNPYKIISEMIKIAKNNGELIISLFIQEGLKDYGISIYNSVPGLTGEPDLDRTDFANGIFISKTGYQSHWWTIEEREEILEMIGGSLVAEIKEDYFYILHVKY